MSENNIGRNTVMTPEVFVKLDEAFSNGATDKEAIFIAGISKDAFYKYVKENPQYNDRIDALRDMIKYQARRNIVRSIREEKEENKRTDTSQWYLERKAKDEFSTRTETTGKDGKDLNKEPSEKILELAKMLKNAKIESNEKGQQDDAGTKN